MPEARGTHEGYTLILGTNEIRNCTAALVLAGKEVFRLREDEQHQLLIDCDFHDPMGVRVAKIARNHVAAVAAGFRAQVAPGQPAEVVHLASGKVVGRITRLGPRRLAIIGPFCVDGIAVVARDTGLQLPNGLILRYNVIEGFGKAIKLDKHSSMIGLV